MINADYHKENQPAPSPIAAGLSVDDLAARCRQESATESAGRDPRYCLELFRRAIVSHDGAAWDAIHAQYYALVQFWLRDAHEVDDLIQETFWRFYQKVTPEELASGAFPTLGSILAYMHVIAVNQMIDQQRKLERERRALGWRIEPRPDAPDGEDSESADCHAPDGLDDVIRQELATLIRSLIPNETEWLAISLSYGYELPPREIARLDPQRFPSADEVSKIKERVKKRLRREASLRRYFELESENAPLWRSILRRLR